VNRKEKENALNERADSARLLHPYLHSRIKRVMDISFSLIGIVITGLIFPIIGALILLDSRGPILYRQTRTGIDGRTFSLVKFRTMISDAEAGAGPKWATENDPRVTRFGRIMRRTYIDEFPQWWNVLKGDMSVVGPRPERPEMNRIIEEQYPSFPERLVAKPGITGLAQTEYRYTNSISGSRKKLNYDQRYISNASFALDIWIVFRTFRRVLLRRGS